MKKTILYLIVCLIVSLLICFGCTDKESVKALSECEETKSTMETKQSKCESSLVETTNALNSAMAKIKIFNESPAGVYQKIITLADKITTVSDIDALLTEIIAFKNRFPTAVAEQKSLKKLKIQLKKTRSTFKKQEDKSKSLLAIKDIRQLLNTVKDGNELAAGHGIVVSSYLKEQNLKYNEISKLPKGSYAETMKDPDAERGMAMSVNGKVIQISKDGDYFVGLICADKWCNKIIYFITPGTTRKITSNRWAKFSGIITQRYSYSNVSGGQTHSILLVGYFKGQS